MRAWLLRALPARDRAAIGGDLLELYREERAAVGPARARLRYARRLASVLAWKGGGGAMRATLMGLTIFSVLAAAWLVLMEGLLRQPGWPARMGADGLILAQCGLTLALLLAARTRAWALAAAGAVALFAYAAIAFYQNERAAHFEGFVFLISLALMAQAALTLGYGIRRRGPA